MIPVIEKKNNDLNNSIPLLILYDSLGSYNNSFWVFLSTSTLVKLVFKTVVIWWWQIIICYVFYFVWVVILKGGLEFFRLIMLHRHAVSHPSPPPPLFILNELSLNQILAKKLCFRLSNYVIPTVLQKKEKTMFSSFTLVSLSLFFFLILLAHQDNIS